MSFNKITLMSIHFNHICSINVYCAATKLQHSVNSSSVNIKNDLWFYLRTFKVKRYRCYCAIGMHMLTGAELGRVLPFPSSMSRWSDQPNYRRQCRLCFTMYRSSLNCTLFKDTSCFTMYRSSLNCTLFKDTS